MAEKSPATTTKKYPIDQKALVRMANPRKISPVSGSKTVASAGTAERLLPLAITDVNDTTKVFTISGDYTDYIDENDIITVVGSTGNDGDYTVVSVEESGGSTLIEVSEDVPDGTVDGNIILDILCRKIRVQALSGNSDSIWVGGSNVEDGKGEELTPGETTVISADQFSRLDLNTHWIDAVSDDDGVSFSFYRE